MSDSPASFQHAGNLKACLFDFGGTLDADGITWQDHFYPIYRKHGYHPDREDFRQAFYSADDSLTESKALLGLGVKDTVEAQVARVLGALGFHDCHRQIRSISGDFIDGLRRQITRNFPLLASLERRFTLGIVSNFYGNLERVCEDLGIRNLFACVVDSNLEGVMKPAPRIFQVAMDRLGVKASEAVFIGDSLYRDMEGAKGVGMPHIWISGRFQTEKGPCCPGDPVIHSLLELESLLINGNNPD